MRVLFYLPVVTPWWFDNIVARLIERVADEAEVHVMVPPLWSGTGIDAAQLLGVAGCERIAWHILDDDDHPRLRTSAADRGDLLALVRSIDADLTLCRSADLETPRRFPGTVRHIMEGGFPPFPSGNEWIVLRDHPFDHGVWPKLDRDAEGALLSLFDPAWHATHQRLRAGGDDRETRLARLGLPSDRTILALPLEYEHEENFFGIHRPFHRNADLVATLAEACDDKVLLAVTDHPLNTLYCDRTALDDVVSRFADRVRLVGADDAHAQPTLDAARACDGFIVGNSKTISLAAFFGKPVLRLSDHPTGAWMNADNDLGAFVRKLKDGQAKAPSAADARSWFAFHVANCIIDPTHPDTNGRLILDMAEAPVDPKRWDSGMRRYADAYSEAFQ